MNNFYNEPAPVHTLYRMGSVIPIPAFPICMTAVLCVKLGNAYGVSHAAQGAADGIIQNTTIDRWVYFFKECVQSNDRLLYKLTQSKPLARCLSMFSEGLIENIIPEIQERDVINLLKYTKDSKRDKIIWIANQMVTKLGYVNK